MTTNELRNVIRDSAASDFIEAFPMARALVGKDYTFIVPYEVEGVIHYAKFGITSLGEAATKVKAAFNVDEDSVPAMEAFENMKNERAANEAARKAESEAKKKK